MLFFSLCNKLLINNEQADNVIMRAGGKKESLMGHFWSGMNNIVPRTLFKADYILFPFW